MMRLAPPHCVRLGALVLLAIAAGCGDSSVSVGVPTEHNGPTIQGQVAMPNGTVAGAPGALGRVAARLVAVAHALTGTAEPVGADVTVRLVRIGPNNIRDGAIVNGTTLADVETNADGVYAVRLPTGTDPDTCRFLLEVGNRRDGTLTRAFVDDTVVDIDFESEAAVRLVLAEIEAGRTGLCDLDAAELRSIRRAVEQSTQSAAGSNAAELNNAAFTAANGDPAVRAAIQAVVGGPTPVPPATNTAPVQTATATATQPGLPTRTNTTAPTRTPTAEPTATEPGLPTRTATQTPEATHTTVPTNTLAPTHTPPPPTSTFTPIVPTATFTATPAQEIGSHECVMVTGGGSKLAITTQALPLSVNPSGSLQIECGSEGPDGIAPCTCSVNSLAPVVIPAIGDVCVNPSAGCPTGQIDCDGGSASNVDVKGDHNIGACTTQAGCASACEAHCATFGETYEAIASSCEGYCQGGVDEDDRCANDTECTGGTCVGQNPPAHVGVCNCVCSGTGLGAPSAAGSLTCNVGVQINVELPSNGSCGDTATIVLPPQCGAVTTAQVSGAIAKGNNTANVTVSAFGPPANATTTGAPISCAALAEGSLTGLKLVGSLAFFDSTLGDIHSGNAFVCE